MWNTSRPTPISGTRSPSPHSTTPPNEPNHIRTCVHYVIDTQIVLTTYIHRRNPLRLGRRVQTSHLDGELHPVTPSGYRTPSKYQVQIIVHPTMQLRSLQLPLLLGPRKPLRSRRNTLCTRHSDASPGTWSTLLALTGVRLPAAPTRPRCRTRHRHQHRRTDASTGTLSGPRAKIRRAPVA